MVPKMEEKDVPKTNRTRELAQAPATKPSLSAGRTFDFHISFAKNQLEKN